MTVYRPTRNVTATLLRVGDMLVNNPRLATPPQYADAVESVTSPVVAPTQESPTPAFVHPEAVGTMLSTYDDVVIDPLARISSLNAIQTNWTTEVYRMMQLYEKPFWILIRVDGYDHPLRNGNAELSINTAIGVMQSVWADALNYQLTKSIAGFAVLNPNLNVMYADGSVITRLNQSQLVQAAWRLNRPCMFITTRPFDITSTIGPEIPGNPNSMQPLPFPILGTNPVYRDRVMAVYPEVMTDPVNVSILLAHFNAFRTTFRMDKVTPLNVDCGIVLRPDSAQFLHDGLHGTTSSDLTAVPRMADVVNFLAALGVTNVGVQVGPNADLMPVPPQWLPAVANTSGQWSQVWSHDDTISVEYVGADADGVVGPVRRTFTKELVEITG